jgi:hypothetical protein
MGEEADWMIENAAEFGWWTRDRPPGALRGFIVREIEKAILANIDDKEVWLPKSRILSQQLQDDGSFKFVLPGWLYDRKLDELASPRPDDDIPF